MCLLVLLHRIIVIITTLLERTESVYFSYFSLCVSRNILPKGFCNFWIGGNQMKQDIEIKMCVEFFLNQSFQVWFFSPIMSVIILQNTDHFLYPEWKLFYFNESGKAADSFILIFFFEIIICCSVLEIFLQFICFQDLKCSKNFFVIERLSNVCR